MADHADILPGTLDLLILKAVSLGAVHGYGVLLRIEEISGGAIAIQQGALYPALYGHRQYYQGLYVRAGWTGLVGRSAVLRIVVILAAAPILLGPMGENGARLGVALQAVGLVAEAAFLEIMARRRALPLLDRVHAMAEANRARAGGVSA